MSQARKDDTTGNNSSSMQTITQTKENRAMPPGMVKYPWVSTGSTASLRNPERAHLIAKGDDSWLSGRGVCGYGVLAENNLCPATSTNA